MSDLVAIAYPDEGAVTRATANLAEAIREGLIEVEDVVVIVRDEDGTVDVRQGSTGVGAAAGGGAMWGGLIGLIFLAPLLGMAAGRQVGPEGGRDAGLLELLNGFRMVRTAASVPPRHPPFRPR